MRPIFLTIGVLAALVAASAGTSATPSVSVSVTPALPTSTAGDRSPSGRRTYTVSFRINVSADRECANLDVAYAYDTLFDGRRSLEGSATDYYDTNAPASSASFDVHVLADAADLVSFSARGTCEDADGNAVGESELVLARTTIPAHTCDQGPARVFAAKLATREDLWTPGTHDPVRARHYLWTAYRVFLAKHGRVTYGAPECHGLRVTVSGPASFVPGDYARHGYGSPLALGPGGRVDFAGDQHSGGVATDNAVALPRGTRTGPSLRARFQVVSSPKRLGRITRIRVLRGSVYVAGRTGSARYGRPLVARRGQTVLVTCAKSCAPRLLAGR
jgi:hypothetical protein